MNPRLSTRNINVIVNEPTRSKYGYIILGSMQNSCDECSNCYPIYMDHMIHMQLKDFYEISLSRIIMFGKTLVP